MLTLTEDQVMIRDLARNLAGSKLRQFAADADWTATCPTESLEAMAEAGLMGTVIPEIYGGAELDAVAQVLVVEEAAKVCSSTAALIAESGAVAQVVAQFGSSTEKNVVLPQLAEGTMASVAMCEGDADANLTEVAATAVRKGSAYVLNGTKRHVLNAGNSDFYLVVAMVPDEGLTVFLVERSNLGIKFGPLISKMGQRACVAGDVILDQCEVDQDAVIGTVGRGEAVIAAVEDALHLGSAAQAVGIAQGAMDTAVQYVNERVQFGKRIAQFQNTQQVMAFLQAQVEAARMLLWSAAGEKASGVDCSARCSMAKVVAANLANEVTRKCVQFMGGFGYSREYPVERMMRDAKMTEIYGGTMETQKARIAQSMGVI